MNTVKKFLLLLTLGLGALGFGLVTPAHADNTSPSSPILQPDNNGSATGGINDVPKALSSSVKPTLDDVAAATGHLVISVNFVWMLLCGFLVFFMQAGFALVETGFCRSKNAAHIMFMNLSIFFIGVVAYWASGYALQMGNVAGLSQLGGIAIASGEKTVTFFGKSFGLWSNNYATMFLTGKGYDMGYWALFLFSVVFMDAACTIPTGAMAERWKTSNFILFGFVMAGLIYPLYGNWVWGGGWLANLGSNFGLGHGHVDFAGSSVVHMVGGMAALAGAMVLGPRIGKYDKKGKALPIPGHHLPMAVLGTLVLGFGWFGFNTGSTMSGNDLRIGAVCVNTMLASSVAGMAAMFYMKLKTGKWDVGMTCNGYLAGLVAITAPCAFVGAWGAFGVGLVAGILVCVSCSFVEHTLKLDDPVGAISVHGVNGAWGVISLGIFADGTYGEGFNGVAGKVKGLLMGDTGQFKAQLIGTLTCFVFVFGFFYLFFKITDKIWGIRVSKQVELAGLDVPDCGSNAYPEFQLHQ